MGWTRRALGVWGVVMLILLSAPGAESLYIDVTDKTLEVVARAQSRASFRLQNAEGFTQPADVHAGDLAQWRNLLTVEINHDLHRLARELDVLYPLKALKIQSKYHLVGRFLYEGVYDFGAEAFRLVGDRDRENIQKFKEQYDLWECYVDFSRGPLFVRLGRQNLAWGETDVFRLLDGINPLDNTFGGVFEDLDDRRIPLWMVRGSYNFGKVGPVSACTLEAFCVPGIWDARVAPVAPYGTPYAAPQPESPIPTVVRSPGRDWASSRWGVRLMGVLADDWTLSLVHYRSYLDIPAVRLRVGETPIDAWSEICFPSVEVTGGSLSFWEEHTDVIVRVEAAWFWSEPVFIPSINTPIEPLPIFIPGIPGLPVNGEIPKKDVLKWAVGLDKNVWVRMLNPKRTFTVSVQYFGSWIQGYDKRMRVPLALYPEPTDFTASKEFDGILTLVVNTDYHGGDIIPQMAVAYDARGVWMFQPSVNCIFEPFRFMVQYSGIAGNMAGFGAFRDRDQISFSVSWLLN